MAKTPGNPADYFLRNLDFVLWRGSAAMVMRAHGSRCVRTARHRCARMTLKRMLRVLIWTRASATFCRN